MRGGLSQIRLILKLFTIDRQISTYLAKVSTFIHFLATGVYESLIFFLLQSLCYFDYYELLIYISLYILVLCI